MFKAAQQLQSRVSGSGNYELRECEESDNEDVCPHFICVGEMRRRVPAEQKHVSDLRHVDSELEVGKDGRQSLEMNEPTSGFFLSHSKVA